MTDRDANATDWASQAEQRLLDAALALAPRLGWSGPLVPAAAREIGLSAAEAGLLLPHGARDLAALLSRRHDSLALAALPDGATLKIRERIRSGVVARLDAAAADREAVRRWAGFLAFPTNFPLALKLVWESADSIWRWAGDIATDENHYSKRAIVSGILISTLALDLTNGRDAALTALDARIDNVMAFEKWKATTKLKPSELAREVAAALGRLRYGAA
ncbi:COQ9 family protein [Caulobacter sp. 73W]|uniref:COQ9 family protein n=1 Tax=Caulobacter sp. 73W TaxID=3161137 RepID=A0AB39KQ85_9CAUL